MQWATGNVGKVSIRQFLENPAFDLVGVLVTNPDKVGKDAGELASLPPTGMIATDDVEAIVALDADCVHFAAAAEDIEMVCRLLRTGKTSSRRWVRSIPRTSIRTRSRRARP